SALGNNVYRYYLQNDFVLGGVTIHFDAEAWTDSAGHGNIASDVQFQVQGSTADLTNPASGSTVGSGVVNNGHSLDVTFRPSAGHTLDFNTIDGDEFVLRGPGGNTVALSGAPQRVVVMNDDGTRVVTAIFRYTFTGDLAEGTYTVEFKAGSWADDGGCDNLAETE